MGSIIIERQKVESCAYDLINKSHEEDDLKAREIAVRLICTGEICDNCKKIIDDGGCFIIEVEDGSDQKNPYRTGRYCAIKFYGWFGCLSPETKEVRLNIVKDIIKELE